MGVFDTIIGTCPHCKGTFECQIKAGHCMLEVYDIDYPLDLEDAALIDGWIIDCEICGSEFQLDADLPINKIKLTIKEIN